MFPCSPQGKPEEVRAAWRLGIKWERWILEQEEIQKKDGLPVLCLQSPSREGPHHSGMLVGEKSWDHQQLGCVQDEMQMDIRAPEKQTNLWSREKCRGEVLEEPFSPKETKMTREKSLTCFCQRDHLGKGRDSLHSALSLTTLNLKPKASELVPPYPATEKETTGQGQT